MGFPINERLTEGLAFPVVGTYYGTLTTAQVSAAVDLQKVRKVAFVVQAYTLGSAATLTAKLQGCATSVGSYTDITGSSTTLVKATDDNKAVVLETTAEYLNTVSAGYRYVKCSVGADVSSACSVTAIASSGPEEPISAQNGTFVKTLTALT